MKVWELIAELSKAPAGMDVTVNMCNTLRAKVECVEFDDEFNLVGGDAELVGDDGNEMGFLSQLASQSESEEAQP